MRYRVVGSGRPLGPTARDVLALLAQRNLAVREVAATLQLAHAVAKYTCSRLESSGHIMVAERVHVMGSHKKVRVYAIAPPLPEVRRGRGLVCGFKA